jgi:hypothetical protein
MLKKLLLALAFGLVASVAAAGTPTTNYGWTKPTVGADANLWGTYVDADLDAIDSTLFSVATVASAGCPKAGCTFTGKIVLEAAVLGNASANCPNGTAPTSPATGDVWCASGKLYYYDGTTVHQNAWIDSSITGNAATATLAASATQLANSYSLGITGDLTWTSPGFNGSGNVTAAGTLATVNSSPGACGDATHVCAVTTNGKGLVTAQAATPITFPTGLPTISSSTAGALASNNGSTPTWAQRASVIFQGSTGSISTLGSTNATVTRSGGGQYYLTFTNAFPNTNYTFVGTAGGNAASQRVCVIEAPSDGARTTTAVYFRTIDCNTGSNYENATQVNILVLAN